MEEHDERRVAERCGCGAVGCRMLLLAPERMAPPGSGLDGLGHDVRMMAKRRAREEMR